MRGASDQMPMQSSPAWGRGRWLFTRGDFGVTPGQGERREVESPS